MKIKPIQLVKTPIPNTELSPSHAAWTAGFSGSTLRQLLAIAAILGLMASGPAVVNAANVLYNGNLDILGAQGANGQRNPGPDGWVINAVKAISGTYDDGADSETWCNVVPPSDPAGYGLFFKPFQGHIELLNDSISVYFYQDNAATPGTQCTLSGYAAGEANYSGFFFTNNPPPQTLFVVQFLDSGGNVISSNGLNLITAGLPNGGPGSMSQFITGPFTAPANTVAVRAGAFMLNAYNTTGAQSFFVDAFDLESVAPPGSPIITNQPAQVTVPAGGNASFSVGVSNPTGVSYQWQLFGTNLVNVPGHVSGVTSPTLTVTGVTPADVGHYRALVSNGAGAVYSSDGTLAILGINFYPVIAVTGKIRDTYRVDYATALAPAVWIPLTTNMLTKSPELIIDTTAPGNNTRFYRAVFLH